MKVPCRSPSNARRKRRLVDSREDTTNVMVRILRPPTIHIIPEIDEQGLRRRENVWDVALTQVLVIALAVLVVIAQNTAAIHHQSKPIFKAMSAACYR